MKITRKEFLKYAGAGFMVLSGSKLLAMLDGAAKAQGGPMASSAPRQRWGMVVDTKKCAQDQGCTRCIAACGAAHNIPNIPDAAHKIAWIWNEPFEKLFSENQTQYLDEARKAEPTPVMCNHCDDPPCVRVCPTAATWKRESDGIVMMDWHRCIGCRYCMAACPYGSRSFNWIDPRPYIASLNPEFPTRTKGVVEKCTFCAERLRQGQALACVEACPEKALLFGDLNDAKSEIRKVLAAAYVLRRKPELGTGPNIFYLV